MNLEFFTNIEEGRFLINDKIASYQSLSNKLNQMNIPYKSWNNGLGKPSETVLRFSNHYDHFYTLYQLVFFLKDYGLEYIAPYNGRFGAFPDSEGKKHFASFFLGDYYDFSLDELPFGLSAMHISKFLQLDPNSYMPFMLKDNFFGYYHNRYDDNDE